MPRLVKAIPRYRKHRASGQAIVELSGETFYLGPYGTQTSRIEYDRIVAEWLARGRRPAVAEVATTGEITVVELLAGYKTYAKGYHRNNLAEADEVYRALKPAVDLYGRDPVSTFGPLKLQALQHAMIRLGWSRKTTNRRIRRIVLAVKWGVTQELVSPGTFAALQQVESLKKGRSAARETGGAVPPVDDAVVQKTLPHLPETVQIMVQLQLLTGARPHEITIMRPGDIDTTTSPWTYRPFRHKNQHRGLDRVIFIGPQGQDLLRKLLLRDKSAYCFSPTESEKQRRDVAHSLRVTPAGYGNNLGTNRKPNPRRPARDRYSTASFRRAVARACEIAFGMPRALRKAPEKETNEQRAERLKNARAWRQQHCWSPNQLRHSAGTKIMKQFGLEGSRTVLGHVEIATTQIYCERDMQRAAEIMSQVG